MSEQPQRPAGSDRAAWGAYWQARGIPSRGNTDIDMDRLRCLA